VPNPSTAETPTSRAIRPHCLNFIYFSLFKRLM
jgi:hypothetical protein